MKAKNANNAVDWLLEDDAPGVAYLARTRLLGESAKSRKAASLRRRCNEYPPVAAMLAQVERCVGTPRRKSSGWIFGEKYDKYRGAYWTLIFLADLCADGRDKRAQALAEHVLGDQLENGGFSPSQTPKWEIVCLTANILRALVHLGYGDDGRVVRGYKRLADRVLPHGGVPCVVLQHCLHTSCKMTLAQTLRCVSVAPPSAPPSAMKKLRELLVRQMLDVRIFRYVRPDVKAYYVALETRPAGVSQQAVRSDWIEEHPVANDGLLPKPGWLRFGFPRSYNPDLLEAMYALTEAGAKHDPAMDDALDHIESKRPPDGRWKLDDSLNGKMLADVEKKGRPSKWITLRALAVLSHFGRIRI